MALKSTQEISLKKLKEKQERIAHGISVEERRQDELKAENKKAQKELNEIRLEIEKATKEKGELFIELEKQKKEVEKNAKNVVEVRDIIKEKKSELNKVQMQVDKEKILAIGHVKTAQNEKEKALKEIAKKIKDATDKVEAKEKQLKNLLQKETNISDTIQIKNIQADELKKEIEEKEKEKLDLIELLKSLRKETDSLQNELQKKREVEQKILTVQNKLKDMRRELSQIDEIRASKMQDLDKREEKLKTQERVLETRKVALKQREDEVERLAKTLQKHFDKHNIPIKVYGENK